MQRGRIRGPVIRCLVGGAAATLIFIHAYPAYATNPAGIELVPNESYSQFSITRDWRPYCSPGHTNTVRWYTSNDTLFSIEPGLDCAIGHDNIPGAIYNWNYPSNILPAGLPHQNVPFSGPDGDFYFTLTASYSRYSPLPPSSPSGVSIQSDPAWPGSSQYDLSTGWTPYCTPGGTNIIRWYTSDGTLRSIEPGYDCAVGHGDSANPHIPGAIYLWNFASNILPATLPRNPLVQNFGADGDFYLTLTDGNATVTRLDWTWNTTTTVSRYDFGWHNGAYTFPVTNPPPPPPPQYCTPGVDADCNSNVMFLPGIQGSRLYSEDNGETRLWESNDATVQRLEMNLDGSSKRDDIYTKDALTSVNVFGVPIGVYFTFINHLDSYKSTGLINDFSVIPYDWRLQLDQILSSGYQTGEKISYISATSSPYIVQTLKSLAASSKTGKVTIIAHSNGGLLAKRLTQVLGVGASEKLIDRIIFVASPSLGTPQAVEGILIGRDEAIPTLLKSATARYLAQNMPMSYNLIPSIKYFDLVDNPVISFDPASMQDWISRYGVSTVHTSDQLQDFLLDTTHSKFPSVADSDLVTPVRVNQSLLSASSLLHTELDLWTPPSGIELYSIAGWGKETLSGITYKRVKDQRCSGLSLLGLCTAYTQLPDRLTISPNHVINGDGTVIEPSALWSATPNITKYWVNLQFSSLSHFDILQSPSTIALISNLMFGQNNPTPDITTEAPHSYSTNRLHFTLHSPLTLSFRDASGAQIGSVPQTDSTNIPGAYFEQYGEVQWLSIPRNIAGQLILQGIGSGSFTLEISETIGESVIATTSFSGIPSATSTLVKMSVAPEISPTSAGRLEVDFNGDGNVERILEAKQGFVVTPDITAPEFILTVSTSTKDFLVTGLDDVSQTNILRTATTTTVTDQSGNNTTLSHRKTFSGNVLTFLRLTSVNYGTSTIPLPASLLYVWDTSKSLVSQTAVVDSNYIIEALYDKKKDKTTILVKKKGAPIETIRLPGLRLLKLTSNQGTLKYSW